MGALRLVVPKLAAFPQVKFSENPYCHPRCGAVIDMLEPRKTVASGADVAMGYAALLVQSLGCAATRDVRVVGFSRFSQVYGPEKLFPLLYLSGLKGRNLT